MENCNLEGSIEDIHSLVEGFLVLTDYRLADIIWNRADK